MFDRFRQEVRGATEFEVDLDAEEEPEPSEH
jgi:hypothetical protein